MSFGDGVGPIIQQISFLPISTSSTISAIKTQGARMSHYIVIKFATVS